MHMEKRIILHIDMDAFFAAVEERDKPRLAGLPIVVGADPKDGHGRGVVATANYKAREYGIRSAMPISEAWRRSEAAAAEGKPRAVFLLGRHRRYEEVSGSIMEYLGTIGGTLEPASIDEAYLEIKTQNSKLKTSNEKSLWKEAEKKAREIKTHILKTEKLTCSIGIGPNKLVAKIVSGFRKPDGLTVVRPEEIGVFLNPLPIREIPGIGPKSGGELERLGVRTIRELREIPKEKLIEMFGKLGFLMYERARGIDQSLVVSDYETKSVGEQETYDEDTIDPKFLLGRLKTISAAVAARAQEKNFAFRTVSITVRFEDFETKARSLTFTNPAEGVRPLEIGALKLFLPFLDRRENPRKKRIRLLGVRVEKLSTVAKALF